VLATPATFHIFTQPHFTLDPLNIILLKMNMLALGLLYLLSFTSAFPSPYTNGSDTITCARAFPDLTNCSPSASSQGQQCPHAYTFAEYKPKTASNRQPYFRFQILFKMNPSLCEEQAHEHWKTVHADLTLASKNTGVWIERYVQFHADRASRRAIQSLLDTGSVVSN
jgi:hypothetical protein